MQIACFTCEKKTITTNEQQTNEFKLYVNLNIFFVPYKNCLFLLFGYNNHITNYHKFLFQNIKIKIKRKLA